jgi:hypothetical protein
MDKQDCRQCFDYCKDLPCCRVREATRDQIFVRQRLNIWAQVNPEAANALVEGNAAVVPMETKGSFMWERFHDWVESARLDKPESRDGEGK